MCSNQQPTTQIQHGKINGIPKCYQPSCRCLIQLVSLYRLMWHWGSNARWLPTAFKECLAPLSLRANERETQRDEECHPLKDNRISHQDCHDGVGQGGGSAARRHKNQSSIFGKHGWKKKLFPKLITLYRAEIASSCSFKSINQLTLAPVNLFKELKL